MKLLAILLFLYSSIVFSEQYYGYVGNCNNPIYMFDFKNEKYEIYIEDIKYIRGGKDKSYRLISGKIIKNGNLKYILETYDHKYITLNLDPSDNYLWGEKKENEIHWYKPCNFNIIPEIIKNAKKSS